MTYFAMQCGVVMSKHRSIDAAQKAISKRLRIFKKYPSACYSIARLEHPGYWEQTDSPAMRYYIDNIPVYRIEEAAL